MNDPVYGFINIPSGLVFNIIEHPYFQRLRRIKQLGLTHLVYPGALHTRFHHSLGAMHLMEEAIDVLREKGIDISGEEETGAMAAILLHDIGHGPFSHALEHSLVEGANHEAISHVFMNSLNEYFDGALQTGINIFNSKHRKKFLSQLISGQLDTDRLDYLTRDSFFTGVSEGVIGTKRIIKMLNVSGNELVAEFKGIYSVEKFLMARRLMYWQVYLHKTVIAAEMMLIHILKRAKELVRDGTTLFATPTLKFFLENEITLDDFRTNPETLELFSRLDDFDILTSIKVWTSHHDKVLSYLCSSLIRRKLFRCELSAETYDYFHVERIKQKVRHIFHISEEETSYFVYAGTTSNYAYFPEENEIRILMKNGKVTGFAELTDNLDISVMSRKVTKHLLCYPKAIVSE